MALTRESIPQLRGIVAGSGVLLEDLKRLVKESGVVEYIDFLGHVDNMDMFYDEIDVLLLTSDYEAFGRVLIEAMAVGKPVIAAAVDGVVEVVDDGVTGYLVDSGDLKAYVECLKTLLEDENLRKNMGQAAQEHVQNKFSLKMYRARLIELLCQTSNDGEK